MEEEKAVISSEQENQPEQTVAGKILGWIFGIFLSLALFSIPEKESGLVGLWMGLIGILLIPPINTPLRKLFKKTLKEKSKKEYKENQLNILYFGAKFLFFSIFAIILSASMTPSDVENNSIQSQNQSPAIEQKQEAETNQVRESKPKVSFEYRNALASAETYSSTMHMSKKAIYDQLVSEYGEQFPADAAQYAIDNLNADYNENALKSAKSYQELMHMSKKAIYDQLKSEYGDKFTASEAQYAIDNLE